MAGTADSVDETNRWGNSVLHLLLTNENYQLVLDILKIEGVSKELNFSVVDKAYDRTNTGQKNILGCAAVMNNTPVILKLLDIVQNRDNSKDIINKPDAKGNTPLYYACLYGNQQVYDRLIEMGANLDAENNFSETPRKAMKYTQEVKKNYISDNLNGIGIDPNRNIKCGYNNDVIKNNDQDGSLLDNYLNDSLIMLERFNSQEKVNKKYLELFKNIDKSIFLEFRKDKALGVLISDDFLACFSRIKSKDQYVNAYDFYKNYYSQDANSSNLYSGIELPSVHNKIQKNFAILQFAKEEANNAESNENAKKKGGALLSKGFEMYKDEINKLLINNNNINEANVNTERDLTLNQHKKLTRISTEIKQIYGDNKGNVNNDQDQAAPKNLAENALKILSKYDKGFFWGRSSERKEIFKNFKTALKEIEKSGFTDQEQPKKSNYQKMYEMLSEQKKKAVEQDSKTTGIHRGGSSRYINLLNQAMDSLVQDWAKNAPVNFGEYAELELAGFKELLGHVPKNLDKKAKAFHDALKKYIDEPSKDNLEKIICPQEKEFKALPGNIRQFITDVSSRLDAIKTCHENKEEEIKLNIQI